MYTTPADAPELLAWNNGNSTGKTATGATGNVTGEAYTATIAALDADSVSAGFQPHQAAKYCADLTVHGQDDWHLPSQNEFNLFDGNFGVIGGFTPGGSCSENCYWISEELNSSSAIMMHKYGAEAAAATGGQAKELARNVRCVRRQGNERTSIVSDGLIGHWRLDETSGTTAFDSSGSGYDLTMYGGLTGSDSQSGRIVKAIAFDGVDDYMRAGGMDIDLGSSFTVSFWLKRSTNNGQNNRHIVDFRNVSGTSAVVAFRAGNSDIQVRDTSGSPFSFIPMTYPVNGVWHYYALTYDGTTLRAYFDGAEYSSEIESLVLDNIDRIDFSNCCSSLNYFEGSLDDVRIYNRALSADEIKYLAESFDANVTYDADRRVPKYFNGDDWVAMGESQYVPNAVEFQGAGTQLSGAVSSTTDSNYLTLSFWYDVYADGGFDSLIDCGEVSLTKGTNSHFRLGLQNAAGTGIIDANS